MAATGSNPRGRFTRFVRVLSNEITLSLSAALVILLYGILEHSPASFPKPLTVVEHMLLDVRFDLRGYRSPPDNVVIVVIDEKSIEKLGRFPWSREVFGRFLRRLQEVRPSAIGFDVMFFEAEAAKELAALTRVEGLLQAQLGSENLTEDQRKEVGDVLQEIQQTKATLSGDQELADAMREMGDLTPCIAFNFIMNTTTPGQTDLSLGMELLLIDLAFDGNVSHPIRAQEIENEFSLPIANGIQVPIEDLAVLASGLGHVSVLPDRDGVVRTAPLGIWYNENLYPSLALVILATHDLGLAPDDPMAGALSVEFSGDVGTFRMGRRKIPLGEGARITLNYYGPPGRFHQYSFLDVVEGKTPADALRDKIILVGSGSTATGLFDHYRSPYSPLFPGVEIHATFIGNALDESFLRRITLAEEPVWFGCCILLGALAIGYATFLRGVLGAAVTLLLVVGWLWGSFHVFDSQNIWLHTTTPLAAILAAFVVAQVRRVAKEEGERRRMKKLFAPMVSEDVMGELLKNPKMLRLGGEDRRITCSFTDLEGFTSLSETMSAEGVHEVLTEYFTEMSAAIKNSSGYVDKFMGDGIMAEFGAPIHSAEHALQACRAAVEQRERLSRMNARLARRQLLPVSLRIGLHTGLAKVGNFGTDDRFNYTAMGDMVNLASRLEGVNKVYGTMILVSEQTLQEAGDSIWARKIDRIRVVGKGEATTIYELLGDGPGDGHPHVSHYQEGLKRYEQRDWVGAIDEFRSALKKVPGDGPSKVMLTRCIEYQLKPPTEAWDGVFGLTHK